MSDERRFWPLVINFVDHQIRPATFGEAKAYLREQQKVQTFTMDSHGRVQIVKAPKAN